MQVAHSMHAPVILYLPPSATIASLGHSSLHVPQAMHWSVIIKAMMNLYLKDVAPVETGASGLKSLDSRFRGNDRQVKPP